MGKTDFKSLLTEYLNDSLEQINNKASDSSIRLRVLIFTSFGHIETELLDVYNPPSDLNYAEDVMVDTIHHANDKANDINSRGEEVINDSVLLLKNAKITPYGTKEPHHVVDEMILFTDQIVGLSFR